MSKTTVMKELKSLGSEQTQKIYRKHGATGEVFGVKYGDIGKIVKKIGTDHALAMELWETGNHDARTVATMIANPEKITSKQLDQWANTTTSQLGVDAVAAFAAKTKYALKCKDKWIASKKEWVAATGWHLLACLAGGGHAAKAADDSHGMTDDDFADALKKIENEIHDSPNRVRHSMNTALIAIGVQNAKLKKKAMACANKIGKVEVDHGETSCKTPDATKYIEKTLAHRAKKKTKKKVSSSK